MNELISKRLEYAARIIAPMALVSFSLTLNAQDISAKEESLEKTYSALSVELFKKNEVLYNMERGKLAFDRGDYESASSFFDQAIFGIEKVYSNDQGAIDARKLFHEEEEKPFKGESYERAMVFYYRGLLDLINHDYENARASFESGLLQDSMAINRDYIQDFASLEFLSGWAARCAGFEDLSKQSFSRATNLNPRLKTPKANKKTLILGESGIVPYKYSNSDYGGNLSYIQHPSDALTLGRMMYGKTNIAISDEIYYQAITRGARIADNIAYDKESTKEMANEIASAGDTISSVAFGLMDVANLIVPLSGYLVMGSVGLVSTATSASLSLLSDSIDSGVDIRQWKSIPNRMFITTSSNKATKTVKYISFVDNDNQKLPLETTILAKSGKCHLVRATNLPLTVLDYQIWEASQIRLSKRTYPIYRTPKYWTEVKSNEVK